MFIPSVQAVSPSVGAFQYCVSHARRLYLVCDVWTGRSSPYRAGTYSSHLGFCTETRVSVLVSVQKVVPTMPVLVSGQKQVPTVTVLQVPTALGGFVFSLAGFVFSLYLHEATVPSRISNCAFGRKLLATDRISSSTLLFSAEHISFFSLS